MDGDPVLPAGFAFAVCDPPHTLHDPLPHRPWIVDPYTPVCVREALLEQSIVDGMQDPAVRAFAATIRATLSPRATAEEKATAVLLAVQAWVTFTPDPPGVEVFQPVVWTLTRRRGDCEDIAALVATLDRLLERVAIVRWVNQSSRPLNHVGAFVRLAGRWIWQDASVYGARLGESPYDALTRLHTA